MAKDAFARATAAEAARLHAPSVNYFPPSRGPFLCGNCSFFNVNLDYCDHPDIRAPADYSGCCNRYRQK